MDSLFRACVEPGAIAEDRHGVYIMVLNRARDLISIAEEVKSECSGNYKTFLVSMLCDPTEVDAQALHKAMDGMGTTETILIEIICNRTNEELRKVKSYFEGKYDKPLIDWIRRCF